MTHNNDQTMLAQTLWTWVILPSSLSVFAVGVRDNTVCHVPPSQRWALGQDWRMVARKYQDEHALFRQIKVGYDHNFCRPDAYFGAGAVACLGKRATVIRDNHDAPKG